MAATIKEAVFFSFSVLNWVFIHRHSKSVVNEGL